MTIKIYFDIHYTAELRIGDKSSKVRGFYREVLDMFRASEKIVDKFNLSLEQAEKHMLKNFDIKGALCNDWMSLVKKHIFEKESEDCGLEMYMGHKNLSLIEAEKELQESFDKSFEYDIIELRMLK